MYLPPYWTKSKRMHNGDSGAKHANRTCKRIHEQHTNEFTRTNTHMRISTRKHTNTHAHIHTCTCTFTFTLIHIHTRTRTDAHYKLLTSGFNYVCTSTLTQQWFACFAPETPLCILSRTNDILGQNDILWQNDILGQNDILVQVELISPRVKLIQPFDVKNLRSTFPPSYSRFSVFVTVVDGLFRTPMPLAAADSK